MKLLTHEGRYHADELAAIALLKILHPQATVVRSRDEVNFFNYKYVIDVGKQYVPSKGLYDHHQGGIESRPNGVPYASLGLVWKNLGPQIIKRVVNTEVKKRSKSLPRDIMDFKLFGYLDNVIHYVQKRFDESFVQPIDAWDHGMFEHSVFNLSLMVANCNSNGTDFTEACKLMRKVIIETILAETISSIRYFIVLNGIEVKTSPCGQYAESGIVYVKSLSWFNKVRQSNVQKVISPSTADTSKKVTYHSSFRHSHEKHQNARTNGQHNVAKDNTDADAEPTC